MWDTTYRPLKFGDVLGQRGTIQLLKARLAKGSALDMSYIFSGGSGQGKTTLARILARAMLCLNLDKSDPEPCNECDNCRDVLDGNPGAYVEQDAASGGTIDNIRSLVEDLPFAVFNAPKRVYVFDECFTEDTLLLTRQGPRSIKSLVDERSTEDVLSYDPETHEPTWKPITDWFDIPDERPVIRLRFENGVELTVTEEQEILTTNRGWVKACDLTEDDDVVGVISEYGPRTVEEARLASKQHLGSAKVYDVTVRDTHSFFAYSRSGSSDGAVLAHNCHRMSKDAQDVLLKPLEEKKMVGIFCTTEPEKIRGPIRSRCEEYAIRKITREDVLVRMKSILTAENVEHEDDAVLTVIDYSGGHVRDVVNRLEMVAQMGAVNLGNVREYLHLSVVSTYYEVLLALGTPKRAVELVEELCERVGPEEVSAGLAEAAMNAFRLKHGMFADFVYVDRSLGQRLYDTYGDNVVRLAEYFLRQRHTSKVALLCDVIGLSAGIPAQVQASAPPPVVVVPSVLSVDPVAPPPAPPPVAVSAPPPAAPKTVAPPTSATQPSKPFQTGNGVLRTDGVGNLGSGDVAALTAFDQQAVPRQMPRGRGHAPVPVTFGPSSDPDMLTPDQWKREFEFTWLGRGT